MWDHLILGKTRKESGLTTRSQKGVGEDVGSVRRGNLAIQLLPTSLQPAGSALLCVVPEGRARLKGFRDREADYGESSVTRMFTEGTRAPALWGCATSGGSRHSQLNKGLLDWRLVLVAPRRYFLDFSFRYAKFALMNTSLFINPVQGMSRER